MQRGARTLVSVFFFLLALPFLGVFPYLAAINNPNENTRTYMTMAIVEKGTFRVDEIVARHGWTNDMAVVPDEKGVGHYYCVKAPSNGYLGVPSYFLFRKLAPKLGIEEPTLRSSLEVRATWLRESTWAIRLFSVSLPCFLFLIWFERYLRAFTSDVVLRLTAVAACGIGTNYLGYALMNVSHALAAVASFMAFGLAERELRTHRDPRRRSIWAAFAAGFCSGWITLLEYHAFFMSAVLALFGFFVFYRPKRLLAFGLGGAITIAAMMFFQKEQYGNAFTPGHKFVETPIFAEAHQKGLYSVSWPEIEGIVGLGFPIGSGLFGMSPFLFIGMFAIVLVLAPRTTSLRAQALLKKTTVVWMIAIAALWAAAAGSAMWRAGWTLGPRRLSAVPPFLALGAVCWLERVARDGPFRRAIVRGLAAGTTMVGVVSVGLVGLVYNTLPEEILRPWAHFALPMIRTGFVAHHIGEWFGWKSTTFWYVAASATLGAPMLALIVPAKDRIAPWLLRVVFGAAIAFAGIRFLASSEPFAPEVGRRDINVGWWMQIWEPQGRDRLTEMRNEAERYGNRWPCPWYKLADLERAANLPQADADEKRATKPRSTCY